MANLFRRKKESEHILSGYRVENVRSNRPVFVNNRSVLVGDIYAPQVIVSGMVYGYIVAGSVIVEPAGQVWGDICAASIEVQPGSTIHGWISSIDEGTVDLLRLGQLAIEEIPTSGEFATTSDNAEALAKLVPDIDQVNDLNAKRVEIWRKLQSEAAAAISARIEIEQTFSARVQDAISDGSFSGHQSWADEDKEISAPVPADGELIAQQLKDAEAEYRQLRTKFATLLKQHIHLRNQLIRTKASLQQVRRQQSTRSGTEGAGESKAAGQIRGQHLARLQAAVIDRNHRIRELEESNATREEQLNRIKSLATRRIESLENELRMEKTRPSSD